MTLAPQFFNCHLWASISIKCGVARKQAITVQPPQSRVNLLCCQITLGKRNRMGTWITVKRLVSWQPNFMQITMNLFLPMLPMSQRCEAHFLQSLYPVTPFWVTWERAELEPSTRLCYFLQQKNIFLCTNMPYCNIPHLFRCDFLFFFFCTWVKVLSKVTKYHFK